VDDVGMAVPQVTTVPEAAAAGFDWDDLQTRRWRRVGPGQYADSRQPDTPQLRLAAINRRLPAGAAFAGRTAGWLHGLDLPPCDPVEVIADPSLRLSTRAGLLVRRQILQPAEIVTCKGFPTTSAIRTVADLAWRLRLVEAVQAIDMALQRGLVDMELLHALSARLFGKKGVKKLRRVVDLAEPASESPMETRLRLLLVLSGLPRPQAQAELVDRDGRFVARADLYYPTARLVIEFDGSTHKASLVEDSRRQNRLLAAGYSILRFTTADLVGTPQSVVDLVRHKLRGD
jgi:Protein of unknown function (DUF559)